MRKKFSIVAVGSLLVLSAAGAPEPAAPTYSKDVAPILNTRCVVCHRVGEIAPMPLTNYKEVRPYAKAILEEVVEGEMPPWHADPKIGKFKNDRRLTEEQIRTIVQWVNAGAPEGNPKDLPPPPKFTEGWQIGKPDVELTIPKAFEVPAEGVVDYQYRIVPTNFTEDKWVAAAEIRPGNREVTHHVVLFVLPPEGEPASNIAKQRAQFGKDCAQAFPDEAERKRIGERQRVGREPRSIGDFFTGWAPGLQGTVTPPGAAYLLRAGSRLHFQLHYTPNGKPAVDRDTKVGLIFAKGPVTRSVHTIGVQNRRIVIPPGEANYEAASCFTFARDVTVLDFMPHMHYRGKDFLYRATFPDGRSETLLSVPKYNFNWQTFFVLAEPIRLPTGTRLDCTAHYDNSARNKYNPDPTKEVRWGDQTWEEMMIGWISFMADIQPASAAGGGSAK